jgi:hypothetical protein
VSCSKILQSDPTRGLICRELVEKYGVKEVSLATPQKVDTKAIELAVAEARYNFKWADGSDFLPKSPWLRFLKEKASRVVPFIFDDLDSTRHADKELLQKLYKARHTIRTAEDLHNFVTLDLGLKFFISPNNKTPHALDAVESKRGSCFEFVSIYYGISLLLGLPIKIYDQYDHDERAKVVNGHVIIQLGSKFLDPQQGVLAHPPKKIKQISASDLIAYYHQNQALTGFCQKENLEEEKNRCEERELLMAESYAPKNFRIQYGLAHFYVKKGYNLTRGLTHLQNSLRANLDFVPAQQALRALVK